MHGYDRKDVPAGRHGALQLPGRARGRVRGRAREPQGADRRAQSDALCATQVGRRASRRWRRRRSPCPHRRLAHGLVGRADLPIPEWLFGWAAAVVLIVSFVALSMLWQEPQLEGNERLPPAARRAVVHARQPRDGGVRRPRSAWDCSADRSGPASPACSRRSPNFAPTFIYVIFWVGLVPAQHPVRRRLPRLQPLARDRARRRLRRVARVRAAAHAVHLPGPARTLARGRRPPRLRLDRAGLPQQRRPQHAGDRHARLHARSPCWRSRASAPRPGSRAARASRSTSTSSRASRR